MTSEQEKHWLLRKDNIRKLWWAFGIVLALTVVAQLLVHVHDYFGVDGWFGFSAIYGFITCVLMVVFAKLLGLWLKRPENYYGDDNV